MICPVCGNEIDSELCTCSEDDINQALYLRLKEKLVKMDEEMKRNKKKKRSERLRKFFRIKTSDSNEADAKK